MFIVAPVLNGKLQMTQDQRKIITHAFQKHEGKEVRIEVRRYYKERSDEQNNYMWGVLYKYIGVEQGMDKNEVHAIMRSMFGEKVFVQMGEHSFEVIPSTTTLTTVEMSEYWERVRKFAAEDLGIDIPDPNGEPYTRKDPDFKPDVGRDANGNVVRFSTGEILATAKELS